MCDCALVSSGLFGGDGADEKADGTRSPVGVSVVELRHVIPSQSLWRSKHTELGSNRVLVAASTTRGMFVTTCPQKNLQSQSLPSRVCRRAACQHVRAFITNWIWFVYHQLNDEGR